MRARPTVSTEDVLEYGWHRGTFMIEADTTLGETYRKLFLGRRRPRRPLRGTAARETAAMCLR
ncbi:hypothetical protein [Nonomuraea longicatena]|uniref:Uncharacterized protein n=1 Tax=Nonomuraea longicatena TaxID=83682 RepID=A0ABP3ZRU5_9ACTN